MNRVRKNSPGWSPREAPAPNPATERETERTQQTCRPNMKHQPLDLRFGQSWRFAFRTDASPKALTPFTTRRNAADNGTRIAEILTRFTVAPRRTLTCCHKTSFACSPEVAPVAAARLVLGPLFHTRKIGETQRGVLRRVGLLHWLVQRPSAFVAPKRRSSCLSSAFGT